MDVVYFDIKDLLPIALMFGVAGIGIAYTLQIQGEVQSDMYPNTAGCNATAKTSCSAEYNATGQSIEGVATFADKMPTLALVVVAAILIGILLRYFFMN